MTVCLSPAAEFGGLYRGVPDSAEGHEAAGAVQTAGRQGAAPISRHSHGQFQHTGIQALALRQFKRQEELVRISCCSVKPEY